MSGETDGPTLGRVLHGSLRDSAHAAFGRPASDFATWDQLPPEKQERMEEAAADVAATAIARLSQPAELAAAMRENVRLRKELAALEPQPAPGNAEVAYEQWIEHRNPGDVGSRAGFVAGWQIAVTAASGWPLCPNGCGCRLGSEDADARDCACDGLCCYGEIEVSEVFAERDRLRKLLADREPQAAPELAETLSSPAELARWVEANHGDHPEWVSELRALLPISEQPTPELTPVEAVRLAVAEDWQPIVDKAHAEADHLRELLDEIGVMAANAPEDEDSFGVLEQIAMRIAAMDVPDTTPIDEWPDPENPVTGRTPGGVAASDADELRAVIDMIWRMCQNPKQAAGTSQGVVVNGDRLAERIAGLIKNSGLEPF